MDQGRTVGCGGQGGAGIAWIYHVAWNFLFSFFFFAWMGYIAGGLYSQCFWRWGMKRALLNGLLVGDRLDSQLLATYSWCGNSQEPDVTVTVCEGNALHNLQLVVRGVPGLMSCANFCGCPEGLR